MHILSGDPLPNDWARLRIPSLHIDAMELYQWDHKLLPLSDLKLNQQLWSRSPPNVELN